MSDGFRARPRAGAAHIDRDRLLAELERLRSRLARATRDGRAAFSTIDSDSYDIGMLAVIHLSDFVTRELPDEVQSHLPKHALDGLRATRNIAGHNYAGLDNSRLWSTVTDHAPALLDQIENELLALDGRPDAR